MPIFELYTAQNYSPDQVAKKYVSYGHTSRIPVMEAIENGVRAFHVFEVNAQNRTIREYETDDLPYDVKRRARFVSGKQPNQVLWED